MDSIGVRIRDRRLELGLSQRGLARRMSVSRGLVTQLEGGRPAWPGLRIRLAEALDVPSDALFAPDVPGGLERSAGELLELAVDVLDAAGRQADG